MYGFVLIAVLAATGGVIAYIGDKLGTKIGKRKLTIFGLRPKHTSILVTIVTGILIVTSTLGAMALVSRDVQTALFGMDALKAELASLSQSVAEKNTELEASRTELANKNKEYMDLTAKIKETTDKLAGITAELAAVTAERDRTEQKLRQVKAETGKEIAALQAIKRELGAKVVALNQDKARLEQDKISLEGDVDKLNDLTDNLKSVFHNVKAGYIIYRAGEIIFTQVLPGGERRGDTQYALGQILDAANFSITEKLGIDSNNEVLFVGKADFEAVTAKISAAREDVIVRIIAAGNTVTGEPVLAKIEVFPKRLLYPGGSMVYSQIFAAPKNAQEAEEIVVSFVQNAKSLAIKQGIMPDPVQGTVVSIAGAKYFDTVKKVGQYQMSDKVQLTAIASNDIYTVGPLRIDIRVHGVP
jgi:uncharacterized protein (DUF3084 family)